MISPSPKNLYPLLFLIGLLILTIGGVADYRLFDKLLKFQKDIDESYQTIASANQALLSINEAALDVSVFLYTRNKQIITNLPEEIIAAQVSMANLGHLISDNAEQVAVWNQLNPIFSAKILFLTKIITEYNKGSKEGALDIARDKNRLIYTNKITQLIINIKQLELGQLEVSSKQFQIAKHNAQQLFIIIGILGEFLFLLFFIKFRKFI